jgi:hypothetical protein
MGDAGRHYLISALPGPVRGLELVRGDEQASYVSGGREAVHVVQEDLHRR